MNIKTLPDGTVICSDVFDSLIPELRELLMEAERRDARLAIWKYEIHPGTTFIVAPAGSTALKAGLQDGTVVVWVQVDLDAPTRPLGVKTLMTGETCKRSDLIGYRHLDTVQTGRLVVHVWVDDRKSE